MALNAETKKNSDSKYMNEYENRLCMPKLREKVTLKRMNGHEEWL